LLLGEIGAQDFGRLPGGGALALLLGEIGPRLLERPLGGGPRPLLLGEIRARGFGRAVGGGPRALFPRRLPARFAQRAGRQNPRHLGARQPLARLDQGLRAGGAEVPARREQGRARHDRRENKGGEKRLVGDEPRYPIRDGAAGVLVLARLRRGRRSGKERWRFVERGRLVRRGAAEPGIVGSEGPDVAFGIAAGVAASAVLVILDVEDDLGAHRRRRRIVGVGVADDEIAALRLGAADLVRLLHELVEIRILHRPQHHHAVSERELRIGDGAVLVADDRILLEPERGGQPVDRPRQIPVAQRGHEAWS